MDNTIKMQLYSLLIFTILGIIIGVFFDIFRILRRSFKTPDFVTYIEDAIFWLLTGFSFLFVQFTFQDGQIRSYNIIGTILGFLIYIFTISKYFIKINVTVIGTIKTVIIKILWVIFYPLKIIFKPISFIVINLKRNVTNLDKKIKNNIKNNKKILRKEGFLK